jgi:DNA-binding MarR family transcriptional regulator
LPEIKAKHVSCHAQATCAADHTNNFVELNHSEIRQQLSQSLGTFLEEVLAVREVALKKLNISQKEAVLLRVLERDGPIQIADLVVRSRAASNNFTSLLNQMEENDLIERKSNPEDRRKIMVYPRPAGLRLLAQYNLLYQELAEALIPTHASEAEIVKFREWIEGACQIIARGNSGEKPA